MAVGAVLAIEPLRQHGSVRLAVAMATAQVATARSPGGVPPRDVNGLAGGAAACRRIGETGQRKAEKHLSPGTSARIQPKPLKCDASPGLA